MNGVLVVDKPAGPTSFDVVRKVRHALSVKKVGHTGTLDPMATGVLPICVGLSTRIAGYITEGNKAYEAVVSLGRETDTQDATGQAIREVPVPPFTREALEQALSRYRGTFEQVPPMYSAVKVGGKRLYELARAGEEVERKPRTVTVFELTLKDFGAEQLVLFVRCTKGFFVRTLAHELGRTLGCGAHLKALRRTQSGPFMLDRALPLLELLDLSQTESGRAVLLSRLVTENEALSELAPLVVSADQVGAVSHGVPVEAHGQGRVRVVAPDGRLLAIADIEKGRLSYRRVLA